MKVIRQLGLGISLCLFSIFLFLVSFNSSGDIYFIEDKNLKTFEQVIQLEQFKDKVVYIDLWGTRCKPCIEEFSFNSALKDKFKKEPVEYLYLAVNYGHPDDEFRWKEMVHKENLTGYNMLISAKLYKEVWNIIRDSVNDMYVIPHYIILDKTGKIACADAERPSTKDALYQQLQDILKSSNDL